MEVVIADKNFVRLGIIENSSVIWASRYYKSGDYELHMTASEDNLNLIKSGKYVIRDDIEDEVGIIEDYEIKTDVENGDTITVVGRFAEGYYLASRVISQQTQLYGNIQDQLRNLVYANIINPTDTKRKISFIKLGELDPTITETIDIQITGANLLEKIEEICESKGIGFRMPLRNGIFYFELFKGIDKSYNQNENSWVIFNDDYDNLKNTSFNYKTSERKNLAYVAGEGEGLARKIVKAYKDDEPSGEDRFEIWVDQRNMSSNDGDITDEQLTTQMKEEGYENLTTITTVFDGEVALVNYSYGKNKDLYIGDIVSVQKKKWLDMYINTRVIEAIESEDNSGKTIVLTFGN